MKWPWSKGKTEFDKEVDKLNETIKLNSLKLEASEIDQSVMTANKVNKLFETLAKGSKDSKAINNKLRMFAELEGVDFEWLKDQMRERAGFDDMVEKVSKIDEGDLKKLERLAKIQKQVGKQKLLGTKK